VYNFCYRVEVTRKILEMVFNDNEETQVIEAPIKGYHFNTENNPEFWTKEKVQKYKVKRDFPGNY
jgi:hypothetical protein